MKPYSIEQLNIRTVLQPIVNLQDRNLIGYEALTRADGMDIEAVILYARKNNCIDDLDTTMCCSALRQTEQLHAGEKIFINVETTAGCLALLDTVKKGVLPADSVVMEITERTIFTTNFNMAVRAIRVLGIAIGLDDFGSNAANLDQLFVLKPEYVKLSRTLTAELIAAKNSRIIVRSMVRLSKKMGFTLIVEGIENSEQLHVLKLLGARYGQGYFLGKTVNDLK